MGPREMELVSVRIDRGTRRSSTGSRWARQGRTKPRAGSRLTPRALVDSRAATCRGPLCNKPAAYEPALAMGLTRACARRDRPVFTRLRKAGRKVTTQGARPGLGRGGRERIRSTRGRQQLLRQLVQFLTVDDIQLTWTARRSSPLVELSPRVRGQASPMTSAGFVARRPSVVGHRASLGGSARHAPKINTGLV
jgi:hypothetical protein